jgi:hypothetical protein
VRASLALIERVISGGQTGVDRAALDAALDLGLPCGGWCPAGRRAEDGPIAARYPVRETPEADYRVRTERNVRDSDATLILTLGAPQRGTALTVELARSLGRSWLVVDLDDPPALVSVRDWLRQRGIGTLNCAGPRESHCPGIHARALAFLTELLLGA